ncbi:MAG: hypothetical protein Q4F27_03310 [Desulfovibrionaceae bacterium]|nr:hypothetical protein [Desulfovibrionaceae bacterium]
MKQSSQTQEKPDTQAAAPRAKQAWYAGKHKDALFYLLISVLLVEMIVGGVAFFYGLVHSTPETPGGPPVARFPWLVWAVASIMAPVGLLLVVHLTGMWLSRTLERDAAQAETAAPGESRLHPRVESFYAMVRNAPTVVLLLGILLLGAALFFVDGAFGALMRLGGQLLPYLPWLAGSAAALLAVCYVTHRWLLHRQRRMEQEYAFRREVLERTGIVLMDRNCLALPQDDEQRSRLAALPTMEGVRALPSAAPVLDVEATPAASDDAADNSTDQGSGSERER